MDMHFPTKKRPTTEDVMEALRQARKHGLVTGWTKQRGKDRTWNVHVIVKG